MDNVVAVSSGSHTLAVQSDGTLWAWGSNFHGQVGIGEATFYGEPYPALIKENILLP